MLLAVIALLAVNLSVSSAVAAVSKPTLKTDLGSPSALRVSWTAVKGAKSYRLQYSTSSSFKSGVRTLPAAGKPALTATSTTVRGLTVNKTYYVRLAEVNAAGKVGTWGAAASGVPRYPFRAPGDLYRTKVTRSSMTVSWKAVANAPGYTVRAYAKGSPTKFFATTKSSVNLTGLKKSTTYLLRAYVNKPATATSSAVVLSANSPEVQTATTSYALATPDGLRRTAQSSSAVAMAWTPVAGAPAGHSYRISYALDAAGTDHPKTSGRASGTTGTIRKLRADTTYFAKVFLVDKANKRISGISDFIVAKSRVPRGTIAGTVDGVTGSDLTAAAYDSAGNVAKAVTVGSDNKYTIDVRPGTYRVQLMYTGNGGYASAWARKGSAGAWTLSAASPVGVARNKTTSTPKVTIKKGHTVSGTVVDPAGKPVRDVDVTAISGAGSEREVIALTRSDAKGKFSVPGLGTGQYWFRFVYSGDGFKVLSRPQRVNKDLGLKATLSNADFRTRYKAYINGTRKVGKTLTVHATPWLAGSYPTTRATLSYQWKRSGKAIKGATRTKYKLAKADKGKKITITVTARRYGYNTGSTTSKSVKIS